MKLFHLADLHIGKKVNGYSMIDDQRAVLTHIYEHIKKECPDALILAGDIYDRRNPPVEAVALFDEFVSQVILDLKVPILAIGGNHDGGERLGFANAIQARAGLYLAGSFSWPLPKVRLEDDYGAVDIYLMAYADLAVLYTLVPETKEMNYAQAMDWILTHTELDPGARHVLVAHGVVVGDAPLETCDSERALSIGGTEFWQSASLRDYDYVALGHLHQMQQAGSVHICYAGSILQYSFSEENQQKFMLAVELNEKSDVNINRIPLYARHPLTTVQGMFEDLLALPERVAAHQNDYLRVVLEDTGSLFEPMQRLKNIYPHIMLLERAKQTNADGSERFQAQSETAEKKRSPLEMFVDFYEQMTDELPDEVMCQLMQDVFADVQKEAL